MVSTQICFFALLTVALTCANNDYKWFNETVEHLDAGYKVKFKKTECEYKLEVSFNHSDNLLFPETESDCNPPPHTETYWNAMKFHKSVYKKPDCIMSHLIGLLVDIHQKFGRNHTTTFIFIVLLSQNVMK